jgi:hypothetical protein
MGAQTCLASGTFSTCTCTGGQGGPPDSGAAAGKRIFITSATYEGYLGGLDGADAKCNTAASAAFLGGTWKAWLSDASTNAIDRINDVGPWSLLNGTRVFNNKANLATFPHSAIDVTDHGNHEPGPGVWTGTLIGGTKSVNHCDSWLATSLSERGTSGMSSSASSWTEISGLEGDYCRETRLHLYCIEQ